MGKQRSLLSTGNKQTNKKIKSSRATTFGSVRFGSVRFGSVVSGALARTLHGLCIHSFIENSSRRRGNARTRRTMAKKAAKERMDKGRDALVNMATVSKPTTLVRPRYEHE